jgi:hypothetical protein
MSSYPVSIRRCQHIKVNGTQCGSPALRNQKHCHFHNLWFQKQLDVNKYVSERLAITLPTLEDANSIQVGLTEVMRLLIHGLVDHPTAALLLRALRTAAFNLKYTSLEPEQPTQVVIDPESVEQRPLGATAWSAVEGREYDEIAEKDAQDEHKDAAKKDKDVVEVNDAELAPDSMLMYLYERRKAHEPGFRDERIENALARQTHQKRIVDN